MDLDPRDEYEYHRDYYSTGGYYRPPRRPRNYGWMVAVLGLFLLCVAGGMVLSRDGDGESAASLSAEQSVDDTQISTETTVRAEAAVMSEPQPSAEPEPETVPEELYGSFQLEISETEGQTMDLPSIYQKVIPSVVSITAVSGSTKSTGTGIILSSDGYIVTNYHVVSDAQTVTVLLTSEEEYTTISVGGDETSDLAVLKINATGLTPAEFGSSDTVQVGDSVVAIGDPLGIELRGTMTDGIICGIQRDVHVGDRTMTLIQTNAALNSGNSGGPLVNMSGQVIGINTMKLSSDYTPVEGIGFAIPISSAKSIIDELVEKGYVSGRPAFGFTVEVLSAQMQLFYDLPGTLYIKQVSEGSDAYAKGIRAGDIITAINGTEVSAMDEFNTIKNQFSAGDIVTLTIYRKGAEEDVEVRLMDQADLD